MFWELEFKEGWGTVVLLMIVYLCVAWSIQFADWTYGLSVLKWVVLVGGLLGTVLAKSRVPSRLAHLLSLLGGLTWGAYLTSRVLAGAMGLPVEEAVVELERRFREWLSVLFSGGTSAGNYIFVLLLALLLWVMAYFGAWAIFRWRRVWWTVIVCGVALMVNINAAPGNLTSFLIAYTLFGLLLVVRTSLAFYEEEWRSSKVGYSSELVYSFLRAGLVVSIVAILLAWAAPVALASRPVQEAWDKVSAPWRRLQDQTSRFFQDLNYQNQPAFITFSRSMKFGGAVELSDAPVMDIESPAGRYWRVIVFHEYTNDGWTNTDTDTILLTENDEKLASPDFELRHEVTQTITLRQNLGPSGVIVAAAQPLRSSLPLRVVVSMFSPAWEEGQSPEAFMFPPAPGDPSILYSRIPLKAGESYQVSSSLTKADAESLRQAGTDYPEWVVPRYLKLPGALPQRVRLLAEQITDGRATPYDKAMAIERYLRDIPYNERIEGPEPGQDGVDYFLFEAREGYCDYYSSAMVVMLRAVGVPARYVRGFSQTVREEGVYHILDRNGHAWPEVFFPGYGWVEFEPTAGEPVLVRPRSQDEEPAGGVDDRERYGFREGFGIEPDDVLYPQDLGPQPIPTPETFWSRLGRWGGLLLASVAFVLVAIALLMVRRQRRIEGLTIAERVYEDLVNWVKRLLRIQPLAHQTPHEYAEAVAWVVPKGRQAVDQITDLYVQERFGGKTIPGEQAEDAWSEAWPILWRRWLARQGERVRDFRLKLLPAPPTEPDWEEIEKASQS